jgi:hypothetical protein
MDDRSNFPVRSMLKSRFFREEVTRECNPEMSPWRDGQPLGFGESTAPGLNSQTQRVKIVLSKTIPYNGFCCLR